MKKEDSEEYQLAVERAAQLRDTVDVLRELDDRHGYAGNILEKLKQFEESGYAQMAVSTGEEEMKAYQQVRSALESVNPEVASTAHQAAMFWVAHAKVMAEAIRNSGKKDYTIQDYLNDRLINVADSARDVFGYTKNPSDMTDGKLAAQYWQAMYRKDVANIQAFIDAVETDPNLGKAYYRMGSEDNGIGIPYHKITHIQKDENKHPLTKKQWQSVEDCFTGKSGYIKNVYLSDESPDGTPNVIFELQTTEGLCGMIVQVSSKGRALLTTALFTTQKAFDKRIKKRVKNFLGTMRVTQVNPKRMLTRGRILQQAKNCLRIIQKKGLHSFQLRVYIKG